MFPNSPYFFQETDHGTKVLSAMGANEPQVLVGTAPDARYWLLRCEDQQSEQPVEEDYWAMAAESSVRVWATMTMMISLAITTSVTWTDTRLSSVTLPPCWLRKG